VKASEQQAHAATWYGDTIVETTQRGPLTADIDVDACVVGAGLAGLTTARELARRGWSVAVMESRQVASNASGRNTGFVLPGFAESMDVIVRRVGLDHAKALWALSEAGLDYVRMTIEETNMPGVSPTPGWLKVSKTDRADEDVALVTLIGQDFGSEVEGWPTDRVRSVLKSEHYFHAIHYPRAFHIHALNYALGLAAAAEAAGARIYERTPVLSIDVEGVRKRVTTPTARVRANHIVLAGGVHLGAVVPRIAGTLLPVWTYVATTEPLGRILPEVIAYRGAVSDGDHADSHYRIVGGDRLMWAGAMTTWEGNPRHFARRLKGDMARIYPLLSGVEVAHVWTGALGLALHRMPQIGELTPRIWLASGFGGHGLNTTAMAGNLVARAIAHGDDAWKLFLPFELVWSGGRIGRAVAQVHYWWRHKRELSNAREAREREREYHRAEKPVASPDVTPGADRRSRLRPGARKRPAGIVPVVRAADPAPAMETTGDAALGPPLAAETVPMQDAVAQDAVAQDAAAPAAQEHAEAAPAAQADGIGPAHDDVPQVEAPLQQVAPEIIAPEEDTTEPASAERIARKRSTGNP
jgi:glycine/D-amino acid oxidase-like deaminating enzyme